MYLYRAGDLFERIKGQYGAGSCYLLQVNSRLSSVDSTESLPDPWSQFIRHQRYTTVCVCEGGVHAGEPYIGYIHTCHTG